jgi:hypothetical protein
VGPGNVSHIAAFPRDACHANPLQLRQDLKINANFGKGCMTNLVVVGIQLARTGVAAKRIVALMAI